MYAQTPPLGAHWPALGYDLRWAGAGRRHFMQFGIFSVSDITRDPVSGETPTEAARIEAIVRIAQKADEVGLDVFAIGEHHNPPFFSSSPTTLLAFISATTRKLIVSTATRSASRRNTRCCSTCRRAGWT
jgi:hypothetical protein